MLPWVRWRAKRKHKLPWAIGYENSATGEITVVDSEGHTVLRLGASLSPKINARETALYLIQSCNSYGETK